MPINKRRIIAISSILLLAGAAAVFVVYGRGWWVPAARMVMGRQTVESVVAEYGDDARSRLRPWFEQAGVSYPPAQVWLVASKHDAWLELWARDVGERSATHVHTFPIRALSGELGPKLREGDRQVPEGVYRIVGLNPNSSYHLSMKLDYPNAFDLERAEAEGRDQPGSNIFIHGKAQSVGCLAMGDPAIEELFVLVAETGQEHCRVLICPRDPKLVAWDTPPEDAPPWTADLYAGLRSALGKIGYPVGR